MISGYTRTVITPWGRETYQVVLDREDDRWVARIVTLPNRMWATPGGREALKFHALTKEEAEGQAARFIEEERLARGHRANDRPVAATSSIAGMPEIARSERVAPRFPTRMLLRFGTEAPTHPGVTGNLSETGLFVITGRPGPVGLKISIDLRLPEAPVVLSGEVVWQRSERQEGLSIGFGVRLIVRPPAYLTQVRSLRGIGRAP